MGLLSSWPTPRHLNRGSMNTKTTPRPRVKSRSSRSIIPCSARMSSPSQRYSHRAGGHAYYSIMTRSELSIGTRPIPDPPTRQLSASIPYDETMHRRFFLPALLHCDPVLLHQFYSALHVPLSCGMFSLLHSARRQVAIITFAFCCFFERASCLLLPFHVLLFVLSCCRFLSFFSLALR